MTDARRQRADIVTAFVIRLYPSSVLRRPRSETNANRARGRDALPDGTADLEGTVGLIDEART
jgi:hypothetical protein